MFLGDIDASGNLNANIIHAFSTNIFSRFVAQVSKKYHFLPVSKYVHYKKRKKFHLSRNHEQGKESCDQLLQFKRTYKQNLSISF